MGNRDLTRGNVFGVMTAFALPMLAGNLLQQAYNLVDTWVVGKNNGAAVEANVVQKDGAASLITVAFVSDDVVISKLTGASPLVVTMPAALQKEGFTFLGWSDGTTTYDPEEEVSVTASTTFKAAWEANAPAQTVPQTGETHAAALWLAISATLAAVFAGVYVCNRRKRANG